MNAKKILEKSYKDIICIVIMLLAVLTIVFRLYELQDMNWNIPLAYDGGDDMSYLVNAKTLLEEPWTLQSDRLAAPYGSNENDFFASNLHSVDVLILKGIVGIVQNPAMAVNILFFSVFPMIALITYFVLRCLKLKPWIAAVGGLLYSLAPYVFMRGIGHFVLSSYYFVPLSILICFWIFEDERFFKFNRKFFGYWKNWVAIISAILIANNGIAYYPYFTCFFLIITGMSTVIKTRKWNGFGKSMAMLGMICTWVLVSLIPSFLYIAKNGSNGEAVIRSVGDAEIYGLKIAQMILPVNSHGISFLENIISDYNDSMPLVNENCTAYLGVIGVIAFLGLLLFLFIRNIPKNKPLLNRLMLLSELNICAILLGTVGGFSSLVSVAVTSMIRCYNRISIFILFLCILAVCLVLNEIAVKIFSKRYVYIAFIASVCILSVMNVYEGWPGTAVDYEGTKNSYLADKKFIEQIESMVPADSMIFQLPYQEYPEGGPINSMQPYDLFRGFIHSNTLRWNYGATRGRENNQFNLSIYEMTYEVMVPVLKEAGFAGVYIDIYAYKSEDMLKLGKIMVETTGHGPLISDNGRLCFYSFY